MRRKFGSGRRTGGELIGLGDLRSLGDLPGLGRLLGLGTCCGRGLGIGGAASGQRLVPLRANPLQHRADRAVHPTQVVHQPVAELMYLLGLAVQRRPLLLHLAVDPVGDLARLLQGLLRLVGDVRPNLLGLLLGLLDDGVGAAPGVLDELLG